MRDKNVVFDVEGHNKPLSYRGVLHFFLSPCRHFCHKDKSNLEFFLDLWNEWFSFINGDDNNGDYLDELVVSLQLVQRKASKVRTPDDKEDTLPAFWTLTLTLCIPCSSITRWI